MVKTANVTSYSAPGTPVTYSYKVTNTGNVTLTPVGRHRPHDRPVGHQLPEHHPGPGGLETCTATYATTQADVNKGAITNTGLGHRLVPRGTGSDRHLPSPSTPPSPEITLLKRPTSPAYSGRAP